MSDLFENDMEKRGRSNYDPVLIVKIRLLQHWYNLSDRQVEREIRDCISLINFLGFPEKFPDRNTIWYYRYRLSKNRQGSPGIQRDKRRDHGKPHQSEEGNNAGRFIH